MGEHEGEPTNETPEFRAPRRDLGPEDNRLRSPLARRPRFLTSPRTVRKFGPEQASRPAVTPLVSPACMPAPVLGARS